jgi:hypothetical protein
MRVSHDDRLILVCDLRSVQGLLSVSRAGIEVRSEPRETRAVVETDGGKFHRVRATDHPPTD